MTLSKTRKIGAHPSFAVALERTLTESFQGKGLDRASAWNAIGSREQVLQAENIELQISKGKGMLPAALSSDIAARFFDSLLRERRFMRRSLRLRIFSCCHAPGIPMRRAPAAGWDHVRIRRDGGTLAQLIASLRPCALLSP